MPTVPEGQVRLQRAVKSGLLAMRTAGFYRQLYLIGQRAQGVALWKAVAAIAIEKQLHHRKQLVADWAK
jgi:hypothetical protein